MKKYSEIVTDWLLELGYTHCFFVSGGNVMHLLDSASRKFKCVPFIHEVGAGIACDYFNEISDKQKAFVLVSAGPALTNTVTAIASAWTESRELLVIAGQSKSTEIGKGKYRQIGFQEIDGISICQGITKSSFRIEALVSADNFVQEVLKSRIPRKGPVYIEFCLDVSQMMVDETLPIFRFDNPREIPKHHSTDLQNLVNEVVEEIETAERPLILLGGGLERSTTPKAVEKLAKVGIPIATTFNGADRITSDYENYAGRPNWYGSRWSNLIIQQTDYVLALGTRLGLLQVGYNWKEFAPLAKITQVDIDVAELNKGFPVLHRKINEDANSFLELIANKLEEKKFKYTNIDFINLIKRARYKFDMADPENHINKQYLELNEFVQQIFLLSNTGDLFSPCSSGATYEGSMKVLGVKKNQKIVTSHALASMGFGLTGGIGLSFAEPNKRVIVFEGDGGFAQNLQELSTVCANQLNMKIFIMDNGGYMSIKRNQQRAFGGQYVGCDSKSGLKLPNWEQIGNAFNLPTLTLTPQNVKSSRFYELFENKMPAIFVVKIDPEQNNFPNILSKVGIDGSVRSNALHEMNPELKKIEKIEYLPYIKSYI